MSESVGRVETIEGNATVIRNGIRITLAQGSEIHKGDTIETSLGGKIGIVFLDKSTFALGEEATLVVDEMVYNPEAGDFSSITTLIKGAFVIISGQIAKADPESVQINTPVATIGIRGTGMAFNIKVDGEESTYTLLFGAIVVTNAISSIVLDSALNTITLTSFTASPSAVFTLTQAQFNEVFQEIKSISDNITEFTNTENTTPSEVTVVEANLGSLESLADLFTTLNVTQFTTGFDLSVPEVVVVVDDDLIVEELVVEPVAPPHSAPNSINGDESNNTLSGDANNNIINGFGGNDALIGSGGDDALFGGEGNDDYFYEFGDGNDVISDISGDDAVVITESALEDDFITVARVGDDMVATFEDGGSITIINQFTIQPIETFILLPDEEFLEFVNGPTGSGADDLFVGGAGNDSFNGLAGDDAIFGGAGNDTLNGGSGSDDLIGGAGNDTFVWENPNELNEILTNVVRGGQDGDFLEGFEAGDTLQFDGGQFGIFSNVLTEGNQFQTITQAYDGTNSGDLSGDAHFVYSEFDDTLYYDNNAASPGYSIIATVEDGVDVTAANLAIVNVGA